MDNKSFEFKCAFNFARAIEWNDEEIQRFLEVEKTLPEVADADEYKPEKPKKGDRIIEGFVSTSHVDHYNDVITAEALAKSARDLLVNRTMLLNHNAATTIGRVLDSRVTDKGLWVMCRFTKAKAYDDLWIQVQEGTLSKFSIRGRVLKSEYKEIEGQGMRRFITEMALIEASIVSLAGNDNARVTEAYISKSIVDSIFSACDNSAESTNQNITLESPVVSKSEESLVSDDKEKEKDKSKADDKPQKSEEGIKNSNDLEKAYQHNSKIKEGEPAWGSVDKTTLPREAHADMGESDKKSTWKYPHHWISDGVMYLHKGGLNTAWAAANGARSGQKASAEVMDHLQKHRSALGITETAFEAEIASLLKTDSEFGRMVEELEKGYIQEKMENVTENKDVILEQVNQAAEKLASLGDEEFKQNILKTVTTVVELIKKEAQKFQKEMQMEIENVQKAIEDLQKKFDDLQKDFGTIAHQVKTGEPAHVAKLRTRLEDMMKEAGDEDEKVLIKQMIAVAMVKPEVEKKADPVVEKKEEPVVNPEVKPEVEKKAEPMVEKKEETTDKSTEVKKEVSVEEVVQKAVADALSKFRGFSKSEEVDEPEVTKKEDKAEDGIFKDFFTGIVDYADEKQSEVK